MNVEDWEQAKKYMKLGNWQQAKEYYLKLAYRLRKEKGDLFPALREAIKCELKHYQSEGLKNVEILTAGDSSCDTCKLLNGLQLAIKDALKTMPIPVKNCEKGFCRCTYIPVID